MRGISDTVFPNHVEKVAEELRLEIEQTVEAASKCGLRYVDVRREAVDRTPRYHWTVGAFDKVVSELRVMGYTTELNTRVTPSHPAQQYDPNRKDWIVMTLTIKW